MSSTSSIALLWLGVSLFLYHQIIVASALYGEDESSAPVCRPFNKSSGMAELCGYNATDEFSVQVLGLDVEEFNVASHLRHGYDFKLKNPSCSKFLRLLHCENLFTRCVPNVQGPFLPCKRVCHAFLSRCGDEFRNRSESFYWITRWMCNLLPEKDDPSTMDYRKRCFEPPGFKACDTKCDLEPLKCFPLVVPECQNLGYKFTIYPEKYQKGYLANMIKKNINTSCDVLERKMDCTNRWFPPCFKEEMQFGRICREDCLNFLQTNCSSSWKHVNCKLFPKRSSANDLVCKITGWVDDDWPGVFRKNKQSQQKGNLALMSIGLLTSTVLFSCLVLW